MPIQSERFAKVINYFSQLITFAGNWTEKPEIVALVCQAAPLGCARFGHVPPDDIIGDNLSELIKITYPLGLALALWLLLQRWKSFLINQTITVFRSADQSGARDEYSLINCGGNIGKYAHLAWQETVCWKNTCYDTGFSTLHCCKLDVKIIKNYTPDLPNRGKRRKWSRWR